MRLFASFSVPGQIVATVAGQLPAAPQGARCIPPERWHVTLAFYGEVDEDGGACIVQRLRERVSRWAGRGLQLRIAGGGAFPQGAVYVAVQGAAPRDASALQDLSQVAHSVGLACQAPGAVLRDRFVGHVTIARLPRRAVLRYPYRQALQRVESPAWKPRSIDLVESILRGEGPRYVIRARIPLPETAAGARCPTV